MSDSLTERLALSESRADGQETNANLLWSFRALTADRRHSLHSLRQHLKIEPQSRSQRCLTTISVLVSRRYAGPMSSLIPPRVIQDVALADAAVA